MAILLLLKFKQNLSGFWVITTACTTEKIHIGIKMANIKILFSNKIKRWEQIIVIVTLHIRMFELNLPQGNKSWNKCFNGRKIKFKNYKKETDICNNNFKFNQRLGIYR